MSEFKARGGGGGRRDRDRDRDFPVDLDDGSFEDPDLTGSFSLHAPRDGRPARARYAGVDDSFDAEYSYARNAPVSPTRFASTDFSHRAGGGAMRKSAATPRISPSKVG